MRGRVRGDTLRHSKHIKKKKIPSQLCPTITLFIRFYFIHFSRLNSILIILFWENTGSGSGYYQVFEISNILFISVCNLTLPLTVRPHGQKLSHTTLYNEVVRHKTCHGHAKSCCATNVHTTTIFFINLARL